MWIIEVPAGSAVLEVLDSSAWGEEEEILLPQNSEFNVLSITLVDNRRTVFLRFNGANVPTMNPMERLPLTRFKISSLHRNV